MATKTIHICDKCRKEEIVSCGTPKGWGAIKISIGYYNERNFELCGDCRKAVGIVDKENKEQPITTIQDRLFEVITEIVAECQEGSHG